MRNDDENDRPEQAMTRTIETRIIASIAMTLQGPPIVVSRRRFTIAFHSGD
jgi:hypothetical protein